MKELKDTESCRTRFFCVSKAFLESVRTNLLRAGAARASTCLYESVCHADDRPIGHEPIGHGVADDELTSYTDQKKASNGACYHQNPQISQMQTLRLHASNSPRGVLTNTFLQISRVKL